MFHGFDQWVRLAIPVHDQDRFDNLPDRFGMGGYLRYRMLPRGTRPVIRNYTVRTFRTDPLELDVDFITHGTEGVAGPWAASVPPARRLRSSTRDAAGNPCSGRHLIVADESGLPAALGVLRDLPRDATGHAIIELFDAADQQPVSPPAGIQLHWLQRPEGTAPGSAALPALTQLEFPRGDLYAFAVGESALATGVRRHLVNHRGVPKEHVTFSGYWRLGHAAPG